MNLIVGVSIVLSITQSILFWGKEQGISVIIFTVIAILGLIYILNKNDKIKNKKYLLFTIPIICLSSTYFIYNNAFFKSMNTIVIILLTLIMCVCLTKGRLKLPKFMYYIFAQIMGAVECIADVIKCFKIPKKENESEVATQLKKIGKGILISIPVILVVLILLISADEIFANMFTGVLELIENLTIAEGTFIFIERIVVIVLLFFMFGGFLINLVKENTMFTQEDGEDEKIAGIEIENTTINTMFTILNIIYLIFCIIQFTNLFTHVGSGANFDYAGYARQGFFQLMFVSFINFTLIFISNINKKDKTKTQKDYTRLMNILIMIFTIIIIISAFYRMSLYEQAFGYTYLRLFVYFILATELILSIPIILYLRGKNIDLLKTSIIIGTTMYLILNFIDIDYVIAKKNIDRYLENPKDNELDISYLINNTGTDAIPEISKLIYAQDENISKKVNDYLMEQKESLKNKKMAWQELNLSELQAKKVLTDLKLYKSK